MIQKLKRWILRYVDYKNLPKFMEEEKGTLQDSFLIILYSQLVSLLGLSLSYSIGAPFGGLPIEQAGGISALIIFSILGIPLFYVLAGFIWALAKLLGGTGTYGAQVYIMTVLALLANILSFPFSLFFQIPSLQLIMSVPLTILSMYNIYTQYHMLRVIHKLSMIRAVAVLIAMILVPIFVILLLGAMFA
jgi:hypothetical protein